MKRALLALLLAIPAYGQTYEPVLVAPVIAGAPTVMTPLNLGDDNTRRVDLGFEFPYFDQTFTSAWVSSNGFVSFQSGDALCCNGEPIDQAPRNTIYAFWTDLISSGNPYIARSDGTFLAGWYGTKEYGTNNSQTFEISLSVSGDIQINFGSMANLSGHVATAGLTGPGADDNVQLFYGSNTQGIRFQSGLLSYKQVAALGDCAETPMDPSCPPVAVGPVQAITLPTISTIHDAYAADAAADASDIAAAAMSEPAQEIAISEVQQIVESEVQQEVVETVAQQAEVADAPEPERLSPDQVAALSAVQGSADVFGSQAAAVVSMQMATASSATSAASTSSASTSAAVETVTASSSPTSQASMLEALNMSNGPAVAVAAPSQGEAQTPTGQPDSFEAMSASPGFSAYSRAVLQDRPDFYAPRDIYRNRRIRDKNFEMYIMTQTNDAAWREMTNGQYGR